VNIDVFVNRGFQFLHAAKDSAPNPFVRDFGKPALDQIDPGTVGWSEMDMKAWRLANQFRIIAVLCVP
jgi:hypothetical protein